MMQFVQPYISLPAVESNLGGQTIEMALLTLFAFCVLADVYAFFWSRAFKSGPIESAMRKIVG